MRKEIHSETHINTIRILDSILKKGGESMKYFAIATIYSFLSPIPLYFLYQFLIPFVKFEDGFTVFYFMTTSLVWGMSVIFIFGWADDMVEEANYYRSRHWF